MFELFNREKEVVMVSYFIPVCERGIFFKRVEDGANDGKLMFPGTRIDNFHVKILYSIADEIKAEIGDFTTDTKSLLLIDTIEQEGSKQRWVYDYWMIEDMDVQPASNGKYVWIPVSDFQESCEPDEFVSGHYDVAQNCLCDIV